jgi:hypothetical protein
VIPSKIVSTTQGVLLSAVSLMLAASSAMANTAPEPPLPSGSPLGRCSTSEPSSLVRSIGLSVEYLIPNDVAAFPSSLVGYALSFEAPVGPLLWRLEAAYGAATSFSMAYGSASLKLPLETPYLTAFVQAGGHYLAFWGELEDGQQWGGLLGVGVTTALSGALRFEATLKGYLHQRAMLAVALGIRTQL